MTSPPGKPTRRLPGRDSRGVTLMELIIVMGFIALLLGLSVGAYRKLTETHDLPAAESGMRTLFHHARNSSRESGYPTIVEIDADLREARARMLSWVANWHFEIDDIDIPGTDGAAFDVRGVRQTYGQVHRADPDEYPGEGRVGDGIRFNLGSYMDCGDQPSWNPTEGILLDAWIKADDLSLPEPDGSEGGGDEREKEEPGEEVEEEFMVICKGRLMPGEPYGFSYFLRVTSRYAVEAGIRGAPDSNEADGIYVVSTYPGVFEPGRWTQVAMTYDGERIEIRVNGVPRHAAPDRVGGKPLACPPRMEAAYGVPLYVSHPDRSFIGLIDEVRVGAFHSPERARYRLPGEVSFLIPGDVYGDSKKLRVRFDPQGRLDPFAHSRPVKIVLTDAEGYGPEERVKREIREVEARKRKRKKRKNRKPTLEEQRTRTKGEVAPVSEDRKITITIELSGHIR